MAHITVLIYFIDHELFTQHIKCEKRNVQLQLHALLTRGTLGTRTFLVLEELYERQG